MISTTTITLTLDTQHLGTAEYAHNHFDRDIQSLIERHFNKNLITYRIKTETLRTGD